MIDDSLFYWKKIIALIWNKRCWKDTCFNNIYNNFPNENIYRLALWDFIKQEFIDLYNNWFYKKIKGYDFINSLSDIENNKEIFRIFLQDLWMEKRNIDKNYWLKKLEQQIKELPLYSVIIITDIRLQNEIDELTNFCIKENQGSLISVKIEREGNLNTDYHITETELSTISYDYLLVNNGDWTYEKDCITLFNLLK